MGLSSADVVNRAIQLVGGFDNNAAVTGSPPNFDGTTTGIAAGILYNDVVQAIGRKFGWDFSRNLAVLTATGAAGQLGLTYEYIYPTNGIQLRQLLATTVTAADKLDPRPQRWVVGNRLSGSAQAIGNINFALNPTNGQNITLNGRVFTFVNDGSGWPTFASNYKINIAGNLAGTLAFLADANAGALTTGTTYLADASLNVATYTESGSKLFVTYKVPGTGGNAYTLAASTATPSGATLAGGASAQQKVIWTDLVGALGVISNQPPESVWDPLFTEAVVRMLASGLDLATAGKPESAELDLNRAGVFAQAGEERTDT